MTTSTLLVSCGIYCRGVFLWNSCNRLILAYNESYENEEGKRTAEEVKGKKEGRRRYDGRGKRKEGGTYGSTG